MDNKKTPFQHENGVIPKEEPDYTALLKPVGTTQRQNNNWYSEKEVRKVLLAIELVNPAHLTMLRSGYGEFPDSYELTEKGVDYIIEQFKKK